MARTLIARIACLDGTHTLEQVAQANLEDCDYLGLGPVRTAVKPDRAAIGAALVGEATAASQRPIFAIGGINSSNLQQLTAGGCRRVAVIGAIMAANNPATAAQDLLRTLSHSTF